MECTDISDVKRDTLAKFIVFHREKGLLINEAQNSSTIMLKKLTLSEYNLTKLISQGLSDKEIASQLFIAVNTVKQHKRHIFNKLNISKSIELVAMAHDGGLIT